jgi:hypothetical protein
MEPLQGHSSKTLYIQTPCSQQELIQLHALCVTPGIHSIMVDSVEKGRLLIESLVTSLSCYSNMACITTSQSIDLHPEVYDCAKDFNYPVCVESFCAEHYFFDFMWIELTHILSSALWYQDLEDYLLKTSVQTHLPVIIIRYSKKCL